MCRTSTISDFRTDREEDQILKIVPGFRLAMDYLKWDTDFFGLPCYFLNVENSEFLSSAFDAGHDFRKIGLELPIFAMWAKLPVSIDQKVLIALQELGCYYIETEILLQYVPGSENDRNNEDIDDGFTFCKCDDPPVEEMGFLGRNFTETRFHLDPNIGKEKADQLWVSYMKTYGDVPGRNFYIAYSPENKPVGAIYISNADEMRPYNLVDIVVVDSSSHSANVGSRLVRTAVNDFQNSKHPVIVSTQHRNDLAVSFYIKNGFTRFLPPRTILHYWRS